MRKLSKTQLAMLERFGEADTLTDVGWGAERHLMWRKKWGIKGMRYATLDKLLDLGLVRDTDPNPFEHEWAITDRGRDYLARRGDDTE